MLWRSDIFYRTDNKYHGFFQQGCMALWRNNGRLQFPERKGLHQSQVPVGIRKTKKVAYVLIHRGFATDAQLITRYNVYKSFGQNGWKLERLLDEEGLTVGRLNLCYLPSWFKLNDAVDPRDKPRIRHIYDSQVSTRETVSYAALIYKSTKWLQFVYDQFQKHTTLHPGDEFYFVANDASPHVIRYLQENRIPHYVHNNTPAQRTEWYINNVYRAWNTAVRKAKGSCVVLLNSDFAFSPEWETNLMNKLMPDNCVTSRLVERGVLRTGQYGIEKRFGNYPADYDEKAFLQFAKKN